MTAPRGGIQPTAPPRGWQPVFKKRYCDSKPEKPTPSASSTTLGPSILPAARDEADHDRRLALLVNANSEAAFLARAVLDLAARGNGDVTGARRSDPDGPN
jgi:hypothetical protein